MSLIDVDQCLMFVILTRNIKRAFHHKQEIEQVDDFEMYTSVSSGTKVCCAGFYEENNTCLGKNTCIK